MKTSKALVNVNHIEPDRWGPPLVDADWYAFCQALYCTKASKEKTGKKSMTPTRK